MLSKLNFSVFGHTVNLLFRVTREKTAMMYGVGNRCSDGQYVLFLDYDDTPAEWIYEEIELLQKTHDCLGDAFVFKTKNGYHVVFLEKLSLGTIIKLMDITSCDKDYKNVPMNYGRKIWVLRSSPKKGEEITYEGAVRRKHGVCHRERSRAHMLYLSSIGGVSKRKMAIGGAFDKSEKVIMAYYRVAERNN